MSWNLSESLRRTTREYPERTAFRFREQETTYKQLDGMADRFASALMARGIAKGDAVALLVGNTPHFVIAYHGILRAGAVVVPINPIFTPNEIVYILANSEAKAVVSVSPLHPVLTSLKPQLPNLQFVIYTEALESELEFASLLEQDSLTVPSVITKEEDLAVILYTSGTTGHPKGAMLTHRNMASNAEACVQLFELTATDRLITVLPIFHVFCMTVCMNAAIASGACLLLLPKFSPVDVVKTIREDQATLFVGVPTMYNFLLQVPEASEEDLKTLRGCISGGAPMPVVLLHRFEEKFKVKVHEGYGLSEAAPVTAFNPFRGVCKPGSIGIDIPMVKNKVVDEEGREVPRGEVGELVVQGPNVMKGYLGMPEATQLALRDGWLYTGDLARMDEEGYLYIVDRKKDLILVGGFNVYPREVEEVLYQHPAVLEAAVIGVADEEYGEVVKAFVVSNEPTLSEEDLIEYCKIHLAKYKIPRFISFASELPKNSTGKIVRRALRV